MEYQPRNSRRQASWLVAMLCALTLVPVAPVSSRIAFTAEADRNMVLALDATYQAAVKANDFPTMDKLLADDFVLVTGCGKVFSKSDLLKEARSGTIHYQAQDDSDRTVRVWGDTAVITAKLWEKGTDSGTPFDIHVWFSDTYVRTKVGWKYVFGQSSLPLPLPN